MLIKNIVNTFFILFQIFLAVVIFSIIIFFIIGSAGVRVDVHNNTNNLLSNVEVHLKSQHNKKNQYIKIADIKEGSSETIVFDSKHEVEYFELIYEDDKLYSVLLSTYIEIGSAMYIVVRISNDGQVEIISSKQLLLTMDIIGMLKNYWYRFF